jgi:threonine/homoserine/homoserine lactone efflux protein
MHDIAQYLPGIFLAFAALLVGVISPGPALLALMGISLGHGRRAGRYFALGIGTGSLTIGLLTLTGLSALLAGWADAMNVIRIAGGCYLLWMGLKSLRSATRPHQVAPIADTDTDISPLHYYTRGLGLHLTNPKAILTWMAIISIGFHSGAPLWVGIVIVLGCSSISTLMHSFYAVAFSTRTVTGFYRRAARWIDGALGIFFTGLGLRLIFGR